MNSGRYQIEAILAEGGEGSILKAWDPTLNRHVAIKRMRVAAEIKSEIQREAGVLASLQHPNIVTIYDVGEEENGETFVIMELVEGQTLEEIVQARPMDVDTFLTFGDQVCRGLAAAHNRGIVHLDIKPANVMLRELEDGTFNVKLLDFGLAQNARSDVRDASVDGTINCSVHTIAPEQLQLLPGDARSDIYALGCVFYFALAGKYPFERTTVDEIMQAHLHQHAVPLRYLRPEVPAHMSSLITRMMAKDPAARPQTVNEVRAALNPDYLRHTSSIPIPPPGAVPGQRAPMPAAPGTGAVRAPLRHPAPVAAPAPAAPAGESLVPKLSLSPKLIGGVVGGLLLVGGLVFWLTGKKSSPGGGSGGGKPLASLSEGLVLYLPFDSDTENIVSGRFRTELRGRIPPHFETGKFRQGAQFTNDIPRNGTAYTDWAAALPATLNTEIYDGGSFSFALWVKATKSGDQAIFGNADWAKGENPGFKITLFPRYGSFSFNSVGGIRRDKAFPESFISGTWNHVAVTFNRTANQVTLYYNGALLHQTNISNGGTGSFNTTFPTVIGGNVNPPYSGPASIDDVAIWSRVLTPAEITSLQQTPVMAPAR
jgi:tRNA A-37 threonylcarbamoyl transferase component Bud32